MFQKREIPACCGKKQWLLKLGISLDQSQLPIFTEAGFPFLQQYFDAGMIYLEDSGLIASGRFGGDELRIRCKNSSCQESLQKLERILETQIV